MDHKQLVERLAQNIGKIRVLELAAILQSGDLNLRDVIAVTFHPDKDIAFRATWLLESVFLKYPRKYIDQLEYLLSVIPEVKHHGAQRHYAKIVMHITEPSAPQVLKNSVQQLDMEHVVEKLFEWMIDPKVKIAVKAFAAEALFNLKERYPWVKDELRQQLQFLMRDGTAAIQAKGRKLLKRLE